MEIWRAQVYEDGNFVYVVMEPAMGGELFDLIVDRCAPHPLPPPHTLLSYSDARPDQCSSSTWSVLMIQVAVAVDLCSSSHSGLAALSCYGQR